MRASQPQRVNSGAAEDKINTTRDPNIHSRDSRQMTGAGEEKSIAARPPQTPTIPIPEKGGSGEAVGRMVFPFPSPLRLLLLPLLEGI